jgi:hypothetical protein
MLSSVRFSRVLLVAFASAALGACNSSTDAGSPPNTPAPLSATPNSNHQVTVTWGAVGAGATEVKIERADATGVFTPITTVGGDTNNFVDTGLQPGTAYQYRVQACNSVGCSAYAGPVSASTFGTLQITTSSLGGAVIGTALSFSIASTGGSSPVTFALASGTLPSGVTLSPAGVIAGTPTQTGAFPITVRATSADNQTTTIALVLVVRAQLVITTTTLPNGTRGQTYTAGLNATGADSVYTWTVESGSLPAGLSMTPRGIISGTPTTEQVSRFTARVRSGDGQTAVRDFTITVVTAPAGPALGIRNAVLPPALSNQTYQPQLFAQGGDGSSVTWSIASGSLPSGITLSTGGVFSGRSTATGTYSITVRAQNVSGQSVTKSYTLTVVPDDATHFNITRVDVAPVPANIEPNVQAAIARWQSVITGDLSRDDVPRGFIGSGDCGGFGDAANGTVVDDIIIIVNIGPIDGVGKILGQSTPCVIRDNILTEVGFLTLDSEDLSKYVGTQTLTDIIFHEMGHILGFGTLWQGFECPASSGFTKCWSYLTGAGTSDPRYTGPAAVREWQALGGTGSVPVENTGGSGTADSHWRETIFRTEIMTGFVSQTGVPNPLSRVSIGQFEDLGYTVNYSAADSFSISTFTGLQALVSQGEPWEDVASGPILVHGTGGAKRTIPR